MMINRSLEFFASRIAIGVALIAVSGVIGVAAAAEKKATSKLWTQYVDAKKTGAEPELASQGEGDSFRKLEDLRCDGFRSDPE